MPRQHERIDFRVQAELHFASGKHEAYVTDISETGCYVDTRVAVSDGEQVQFDLIHPNGGRLLFTGQIAHHMPGIGFGIQFNDINAEQERFLKLILRNS